MHTKHVLRLLFTAVMVLALSACAGGEKQASTGEFIDDRGITARVKTQLLKADDVSGLAINVDTYKGTVQLNGFVDSAEEVERAEEIARSVQGVKEVKNNLEVKGK